MWKCIDNKQFDEYFIVCFHVIPDGCNKFFSYISIKKTLFDELNSKLSNHLCAPCANGLTMSYTARALTDCKMVFSMKIKLSPLPQRLVITSIRECRISFHLKQPYRWNYTNHVKPTLKLLKMFTMYCH